MRISHEERETVHRHIPWSLNFENVEWDFEQIRAPLAEIARRHRTRLVVKKRLGMKGEQIVLGNAATEERWEDALRIAKTKGNWALQEYVEPRTYLHQNGENGMCPFRAV